MTQNIFKIDLSAAQLNTISSLIQLGKSSLDVLAADLQEQVNAQAVAMAAAQSNAEPKPESGEKEEG